MLKHNIKLALRSLSKNKLYTIINAVGMSVGITTFILIAQFIHYHYNYERFNENFDNIYRIDRITELADGVHRKNDTWFPIGGAIKERFPEVEQKVTTRFFGGHHISSDGEHVFFDYRGLFADPSIFEVFTFDFIEGHAQNAFEAKNSIVLSEEMANKLFPNSAALGEIVTIYNSNEYVVTGVFSKPSTPSEILSRSFIVPMEMFLEQHHGGIRNNWQTIQFESYLLLTDDTNKDELNRKYSNIIAEYNPGTTDKVQLTELSALHLFGNEEDKTYIILILYGALALFALFISCINFINLSTALSSSRSREIGIKKVVGSRRMGLIRQFITESVLITFAGLMLAFLLSKLVMPKFSEVVQLPLTFTMREHWQLMGLIVGIMLVTGILSGLYPALYLSSLKSLTAINDPLKSGSSKKFGRKFLVSFQFVLTSMIIFSSIMIYGQFQYIKNKPRGYSTENVLMTYIRGKENLTAEAGDALKARLLQINGVEDVAVSAYLPLWGFWRWELNWEGCKPNEKMGFRTNYVDHNHFNLYDVQLVEGRPFNEKDGSESPYCIINQTAAKLMGWDNPVGMRMFDNKYEVIGVVEDYHVSSVYEKIPPCFFMPKRGDLSEDNMFSIKLMPGANVKELQKAIKAVFHIYIPDYIVDINEYDEECVDGNVEVYQGIFKTFSFFAVITILLSLFGLFGLVSFTLKRRTKEIGIRKSLGSTINEIFVLLARDYIFIILIGLAIGLPASFVIDKIDPAAYKPALNWLQLAFGLLGVLLVSLGSVFYHTLRAAVTNPVEALRYE